MRKLVLMFFGVVFVAAALFAQTPVSPLEEGIKLLNYEKNKSALNFFKEALDKNPADGETIFWYGQALLAQNYNGIPTAEFIKKAKDVYQTGLQAKSNDPWLLIGMSHIQSLEGVDNNAVKQNLEVAITSTLNTKGKFKGKPSQDIINAIGRVFAELPISIGDHRYAIDKLKETSTAYEVVLPSLYINLGINYLKLGGEFGGDAVTAFQNAISKDPKNAYAYYRIGKIYQTQNNNESLEENYKNKYENKTSSFNGVYFIRSKGIFEASIQYKKKSFKLIKNESDLECAKVYNQQALYFNNNFNTNYKLNDIAYFITDEKNHISELEITKKQRYSRFTGVTIRNESGKFRAYIKNNGKVIHCGTFKDEIDAAKAYNIKAEELNKLETTKIKYELNNLEL